MPEQRYCIEVKLTEAADAGQGWQWHALLIRPGLSKNRVDYPAEVLRRDAHLFEGVRATARSDDDHVSGRGLSAKDVIGWFDQVHFAEGQGVMGQLHLTADAGWLRDKLMSAHEAGKTDLLGLSIVADGVGAIVREGDRVIKRLERFVTAHFVDVVVNPGAGGRVLAMAEAHDSTEDLYMIERLLRLIEAKRPDLYASIDTENISEDALLELMEANWVLADDQDSGAAGNATATLQALAPARPSGRIRSTQNGQDAGNAHHMRLTEALQQVESMSARMALRDTLDSANLPKPVRAKLETQFLENIREHRYPTSDQLQNAVEAERAVLTQLAEAGRVEGFGRSAAQVMVDETDQAVQQLNDFFDRKPGAFSFKEAYVALTGDRRLKGRIVSHDHMAALNAYAIKAGLLSVAESVTTSGFDVVLASVLNRRMVEEYTRSPFQTWRPLVDVMNVSDMREQSRVRYGGYGDLPTVTEEGTYTALTTPSDEEATYTPTKKGGTESISLEAIWNDDVQAIQRIPQRLARAAARTLYKFVFTSLIGSNPTIYDSVALFHNDHSNLTSTAFSATQFMIHRVAMQSQTEAGSSEVLGIVPRFLLVPPELEESAYNAFVRTTNNDAAFVQTSPVAPTIICVSEWTDANNWFTICDPRDCPTIEIGFFDGEEPQLFRQDLPNVGSVFTNDTITYKVRHIYGGAVVDYRGMQGAVVA
jgi:hypothetical protein